MKALIARIKDLLTHPLTLIFAAWLATILSRLIKHGDVYGLNYNLFQPDGALYHAFTLHLQGNSWADSARSVNQFFQGQIGTSYLGQTIEPNIQSVILTRPLLSILSVPFVFLLGQVGMLVVPSISFLVLGLVIYRIGTKTDRPFLAVFLYFTLTLSSSVNRWLVSDLTDGLLVAIIAMIYLLIFRSQTRVLFILLVVLALITRPSGPVLIALLAPFAFINRKLALFVGITLSILGTLLLSFVSPEAAGTQTSGTYTVYQRVQDFALHGLKVLVVEFGQLFVMDRVLFVFIVLSTFTAIFTWKNVYSKSYLSLFVACFAMGAWNGALGVNFRYQLPLTISGALVILMNSSVIENQAHKLLQTRSQRKIVKG
jgi:hypothetical protein